MKAPSIPRRSVLGSSTAPATALLALLLAGIPVCRPPSTDASVADQLRELKAEHDASEKEFNHRLEQLYEKLGVKPDSGSTQRHAASRAAGTGPAAGGTAAPTITTAATTGLGPTGRPAADNVPNKEGVVKVAKAQKDDFFDVPDSPSAAILGVTPQKITRPSNPKALIGSLLDGVDEHGNFRAAWPSTLRRPNFSR